MATESGSTTVEITFTVDEPRQERLIAELELLGFDAYLQDDTALKAYIPGSGWSESLETRVREVVDRLDLPTPSRIVAIEERNWNRAWEDTVKPVIVGGFIVTPSWHRDADREKGLIPLEIDPKMSFGTGYHATTRLMLRMMPSTVQQGDRVLDAGTGTGILAIAAVRLGASSALGVDNDPWSERNARENCERNGVSALVRIQLADVDAVEAGPFDVILANIQLDVIVGALSALRDRLADSGRLLVSGILKSQADALTQRAEASKFRVNRTLTEDEWWAAELCRT